MSHIFRILYYGFARHLPKSTTPLFGKGARAIRRVICRHLFQSDETHHGRYLNVEQGAYFGNGKNFTVGDYVGIGKDFKSLNRIVTIDDYLMMGEDVLFLGYSDGGAREQGTQSPSYCRRRMDWRKGHYPPGVPADRPRFRHRCRRGCYSRCSRLGNCRRQSGDSYQIQEIEAP